MSASHLEAYFSRRDLAEDAAMRLRAVGAADVVVERLDEGEGAEDVTGMMPVAAAGYTGTGPGGVSFVGNAPAALAFSADTGSFRNEASEVESVEARRGGKGDVMLRCTVGRDLVAEAITVIANKGGTLCK